MKIRSFLAFDVSSEVKQELSKLIGLLEPKAKGIKWIHPGLMHCTLKFFGDVEESLLLGDVSKVIEKTLAGDAPIHLMGVGVGVFPNWRYPRVIWAGLTGEVDKAIELHSKLERALESFHLKKDSRNFRIHLTLGRAKAPLKNCDQLVTIVEKLASRTYGEILVDKLVLYKSTLTKEGPIYSPLRFFSLKRRKNAAATAITKCE